MIGTSAEKQLIGDVCHFRCWLINCKTVVDSILVEDVFLETVWSSPVCVLFLHLINLLPSKITLLKRRNYIKLVNCEFTLFHSHNKLTRGVKWESYFKLFCQIWKKKPGITSIFLQRLILLILLQKRSHQRFFPMSSMTLFRGLFFRIFVCGCFFVDLIYWIHVTYVWLPEDWLSPH